MNQYNSDDIRCHRKVSISCPYSATRHQCCLICKVHCVHTNKYICTKACISIALSHVFVSCILGKLDPLSYRLSVRYPLLTENIANEVAAAGFASRDLSSPLPYIWRHITVNINVVCVAKNNWSAFLFRSISRSSHCSTTGVTKAVVCVIQSVGWCI